MFCIARLFYLRKLFIKFLPINLNMCFGCSRDRLIETVLLSTHTICFALLAKSHLKWCLIAWRFHWCNTESYGPIRIATNDAGIVSVANPASSS